VGAVAGVSRAAELLMSGPQHLCTMQMVQQQGVQEPRTGLPLHQAWAPMHEACSLYTIT
jgi:hypothetical protein